MGDMDEDQTMTFLAPLAFLVATLVTVGALALTVLRYRDSVLANFAADRDVDLSRDFHFQVVEFGRQASSTGRVRRGGQRVATRRPITNAGWRAAA